MSHDVPKVTRSPRDQRYLRRWLTRHNAADQPPSDLLVARVIARRRGERFEYAAIGLALVLFLGWTLVTGGLGTGTPTTISVLPIAVLYLALQLGSLATLWSIRRADQRLSAGLRQRVARPTAMPLPGLLGRLYLIGAVAVFGGGLITAAGALTLATDPADRAVAGVFAGALVVFAALAAMTLRHVSRRPAIAEQPAQIADDDTLRRDDAHRAITPSLVIMAVIAALHSGSGDGLLALYAGYVAVGGIGWTLAFTSAIYRRHGASPETFTTVAVTR
ncbi:hypothetical protein JQS43_03290 [Natronosporangium hydrolyticum]|uniref:Uncharacterized protein n=1 Tax=Natronosporangium hydrolyticum TaxID=2811111 RepID=A0A895YIP2_9ACTN|nr:hypothetical protein [Natronosporangium hydrolyticum]QSB15399.1 hypothetical protein JQS43_03290 [Natronosporangium hydrolyticum]